MAIPNVAQLEILVVEDGLRLRKFDDCFDFAFSWYQDVETVYLVDGVRKPYSRETLSNMYHYLDKQGELSFIEVEENDCWKPIGDVCFWQSDLPIVIGDRAYRGRGIGKKVVAALINRGRELGYDTLEVGEIYEYNIGSRKCFESLGFRAVEKTEKGNRYQLTIDNGQLKMMVLHGAMIKNRQQS